MPYEVRESTLLFDQHALWGYVPMLASTDRYLCMQLLNPVANLMLLHLVGLGF